MGTPFLNAQGANLLCLRSNLLALLLFNHSDATEIIVE